MPIVSGIRSVDALLCTTKCSSAYTLPRAGGIVLVKQFVDNFAQFEDHVDEGVRSAALVAAA